MEAIGMAEARNHFADMVNGTSKEGEVYLIHSRGTPKAVMISIDEYRDLKATIEEMSDPEARRLLKKGQDDIERGKTHTVEEVFGEALFGD